MNASKRSSAASAAGAPAGSGVVSARGTTPITERGELLGAASFLEGTRAGWGAWELAAWIDDYLVAPGRMARPAVVSEDGIGAIAIDPRAARAATAPASALPELVAAGRERVVTTLRRFIAKPSDDRFLNAAIFANRVARTARGAEVVWTAQPNERDRLSDIVLALFAVDVLSYREFHESNLCVCAICGRISFTPELFTRFGCREHPARDGESGFFLRKRDRRT